jgi:hypothetical protein
MSMGLVEESHAGRRSEAPIRVLTLDESRSAFCGVINYNVSSGAYYSDLRAALLDSANFGRGGVIPRPVELLPSVSRLTGSVLAEADIVLISVNDVPLDDCERSSLHSFVEQGGGVLAFFNDAGFEVGPIFEATGREGIEGGDVIVKQPRSPLAKGPFGTLPRKMPLMWHRLFGSIGRFGTEVLGSPKGRAFCATFEMGLGRGMIACDEEWIGSEIDEGCAVANLDSPKMTLFLNAFAFVTPPARFDFVPVTTLIGDINEDCRVDGADLGLLRALWGTADPMADLNHDGIVNGADLGILLSNWTG